MSHIRITSKGPTGSVEIDGHDLSNHCRSVTLTVRGGNAATVTLDLAIRNSAEFDGDADVQLTPATEQMLTDLGWTPPTTSP